MCKVKSRGKMAKKKKKKVNIVVNNKKKWTMMNPIWCRMKKLNPSSGQNGELVQWWVLVHFSPSKQWCFISCVWILLHYLLLQLQHLFFIHVLLTLLLHSYSCSHFCNIVFLAMVLWFLCLDYCVFTPNTIVTFCLSFTLFQHCP